MTLDSSSAAEIAARLISKGDQDEGAAIESVPVVMGALSQALTALTRWVGVDGTRALLKRSLSRAAQDHPALSNIQVDAGSTIRLTLEAESVLSSDTSAVAGALNAVLIELFELLERLIGADLTGRIVEQIMAGGQAGAEPKGSD